MIPLNGDESKLYTAVTLIPVAFSLMLIRRSIGFVIEIISESQIID